MAEKNKPLAALTWDKKTGCGTLHIIINEKPTGKIFRVFSLLGKGGGCASSQNEAIGRLISRCLKYSVPIKQIIEDLSSISCHSPFTQPDGTKILSCSDGISKALKDHQDTIDNPLKIESEKGEVK
jgi:ribonucleoside-diphosphate reductase alpha chain